MAGTLSLPEFLAKFPDEDACWTHLREIRWGRHSYECPACRETDHWGYIKTRKLFQCHTCGKQTSVTAGTILQDTKLPLTTWFLAAYLILTTKKGISTLELARKTGVSQKTAWFLHHKIISVLGQAQARELFGTVEVDETWFGGRGQPQGGRFSPNQSIVLGMVEQREGHLGRLRLHQIPDARKPTLHSHIEADIRPGSTVRTDGWKPYEGLAHHAHDRRPAHGPRSTHGRQIPRIHLVFANLASVIKGVHSWCSAQKLQAYLDLFAFRFNHRDELGKGLERTVGLLLSCEPLTYDRIRCGGLN